MYCILVNIDPMGAILLAAVLQRGTTRQPLPPQAGGVLLHFAGPAAANAQQGGLQQPPGAAQQGGLLGLLQQGAAVPPRVNWIGVARGYAHSVIVGVAEQLFLRVLFYIGGMAMTVWTVVMVAFDEKEE
jgi:hypothetical protein